MLAHQQVIRRIIHATAVVALALVLAADPAASFALQARAQVTTLSDPTVYAEDVTYTFGSYRVKNNETADAVSITFPADTDVTGATAVAPTGTVQVTGQTVKITFDTPLPGFTDFDVVVSGIDNPTTPGLYSVGMLTFDMRDKKDAPFSEDMPTADYTVTGTTLSISIDTAALDFGTLNPDETPAPRTVNVTVVADMEYDISRTLSGDATSLGLVVEGLTDGRMPAGTTVYAETVSVSPGWDAPPDTTLTAQVVYSVMPATP